MIESHRLRIAELNWTLITVAFLISVLGIYNLHSSAAVREPHLYLVQLGLLGGAGVLIALLLVADYRITEALAYPFYVVVLLLLVGVLVQGEAAGGAQRWLKLGSIKFQPSEIAKLATILGVARYFSVRIKENGYTMRGLLRPLNISRPLAVSALVLFFWSSPWLKDPLGELARLIRLRPGADLPQLQPQLWLKLFLLFGIIATFVFSFILIIRVASSRALLNPWPKGMRRRYLWTSTIVHFSFLVLLLLFWNAELLSDPFGVAILNLYEGAAPGGSFAELSEGWLFRSSLVVMLLLYFAGSWWDFQGRASEAGDMLIAPIDLLLLPTLLILVEPDLGTAGVVFLVGLSIILVVGVQRRSLIIMGVLGLAVAAVGWLGILKDYQKRRILTFLDPETDIQGSGWNAVQSMIAVGSGRWFGKGHMEGTQSQLAFLPEQHTDFAFPVWAEEMGFVGASILIMLLVILMITAIYIAAQAREPYGVLVASGVAALIFWPALINVSMVTGAFPVVGMPLPLFSYGGTSLMTVSVGLALLLNIHWRRKST
ncbi:rod shape-determining protein RodA [Myxococcota bacterium]|nr:rod shape-determining protein RodA [Myxococcota bacterium]